MKDQEPIRLNPRDQLKLILLKTAPILPIAVSALAEMKIEGNQGLIPVGLAFGILTVILTSENRERIHSKRTPVITEEIAQMQYRQKK